MMSKDLKSIGKCVGNLFDKYEQAIELLQKEKEARQKAESECEKLQVVIKRLEFKFKMSKTRILDLKEKMET